MKIAGVILLILGCLLTVVSIIMLIKKDYFNFSGITFIVLGAFLISRSKRKKSEEEKSNKWENWKNNNN